MEQRLDKIFNQFLNGPHAHRTEALVSLLEMVRDALLHSKDIEFLNVIENEKIRLVATVGQVALGLRYHLSDIIFQDDGLFNLQQDVRAKQEALTDRLKTRNALAQELKVLNTDLETLERELQCLREIDTYKQFRESYRIKLNENESYQKVLKDAAYRSVREQNRLKQLASQVDDLITEQRNVLKNEYIEHEEKWRRTERDIFKT
jgi:hypothetical protein